MMFCSQIHGVRPGLNDPLTKATAHWVNQLPEGVWCYGVIEDAAIDSRNVEVTSYLEQNSSPTSGSWFEERGRSSALAVNVGSTYGTAN